MKCISQKPTELDIKFVPVQRRLLCHGHILNLVVKAFLWGEELEAFELEAESVWNQQDEEAELLLWQRRGQIGKLHDIIVRIGRSPQHRHKFNDKVQQLHPENVASELVHRNETKWGGDYNELVHALQHREALEESVSTAIRYNLHGERDSLRTALKLDELHPHDWTILTGIMRFLQLCRKWQLIRQSPRSQRALFDFLPAMYELLLHMEDRQAAYNSLPSDDITYHMVTAINNAWLLLDKYYNKIDETPGYYSAIALHREMKLQWFRDEWLDLLTWIAEVENAICYYWVSQFQTKVPPVRPSVLSTPTPVITVTEPVPNLPNRKSKKHRRQAADSADQLERFQDRDPDGECPSGVLQYWVETLDGPRQSLLALMTVELMSIPAMSDEPEQLFSSAKLLIGDQQNR